VLCGTAAVGVGGGSGCKSTIDLTVDLKTDLRPGAEVATVRTELADVPIAAAGAATPLRSARVDVTAADDLVTGRRVAELGDLTAGDWYLRVSLLGSSGAIVGARDVSLHVAASHAVTVVVTRDCGSLRCPVMGGDPMLTSCVGGRCVDPRCTAAMPELCGDPACVNDAGCTASIACARAVCVERECFEVLDDARCVAGERCDAARGCVAMGPVDAGPPPRVDGGPPPPVDAGPSCPAHETACTDGVDDDCDGMTDCADSDCNGAACDDGDACTHTDRCATGACRGTSITCASSACMTRSCNGSATCTATPTAWGTACSIDTNPCTADLCDGSGTCIAWTIDDGTMMGDYYHRCCGAGLVDIGADDGNCGGCGISCEGRGCALLPGTFFPGCRCAMSNAQCVSSLGAMATCYNRGSDPDWYCNCQQDSNCAAGQTCAIVSGHNYCTY